MVPMRMTHALFWIASVLSVILVSIGARASEEKRVLLVSTDPALDHAVSSALRPWSITIVHANVPNLGPTMPLAASQAKELAESEHVDGVVWVSASEAGPALWTYDAETGQATSRPLPSAPPYDEERAASVALSLKTLLRSTQVAPVVERIAQPPPPKREPSPVTPPVEAHPPAPMPKKESSSPRPEPADSAWTAEATFGVRFAATNQAAAEPRIVVAAGRRWGRVGVSLFGSFGPGIEGRDPAFTLRLTDVSFGARGRFVLASSEHFALALDGVFAAHVLRLTGDAGMPRTPVGDTRFDASLAGGVYAAFRPARHVSLGIAANAGLMFLRQQYFVMDMLAFDERPGFVEIAFGLGVEL